MIEAGRRPMHPSWRRRRWWFKRGVRAPIVDADLTVVATRFFVFWGWGVGVCLGFRLLWVCGVAVMGAARVLLGAPFGRRLLPLCFGRDFCCGFRCDWLCWCCGGGVWVLLVVVAMVMDWWW